MKALLRSAHRGDAPCHPGRGRSAVRKQLKTWRHGVVEAKSDAGFVFMASKGGFAEKQGLKIEMVQFKGDALALKALLAGELDSYEGSPAARSSRPPTAPTSRSSAATGRALTYGIFAKPSIASPEDLKGKTFAISSPGALPDLGRARSAGKIQNSGRPTCGSQSWAAKRPFPGA